MTEVILGHGEYKGYRLQEIPETVLHELAAEYPLDAYAHDESDRGALYITVAVHQEVQRRLEGGNALRHRPTRKELAKELISKGFHALSKSYHPDRNGDGETQTNLTAVRDLLRDTCDQMEDEYQGRVVFIPQKEFAGTGITDEDIPF